MTMYIKGLGLCTPGKPVSNAALAQRFALNEEWISLYLGNQSRYFATDLNSGVQHYSLMDIARQAAIAAIDNAQIDKSKIDFIILATATPDKLMPATVNEVAHDLEMFNIPTYQLQSGCCGAMQALNLANDLLSVGRYRYGLVIGADICNKFIDPLKDYSDSLASEIINFALFGDGAGAVVLTANADESPLAITHLQYRMTESTLPAGQIVNWQGSRIIEQEMLREDYKNIETHVPLIAEEQLGRMLSALEATPDEIDWFLVPQLSGRMTTRLIDALRLPTEKTINCVAQTGNNGNALLLFQLSHLLETFQPGQRAIALTVESSRWLSGGLALQHHGVK
ncbi:3-oxoacyl-[acyl-carrier-protein] synthase III C-terminal domain-containing protein [Rouxiella badensis]|jgi:3-oxoacyl-[acyl-carrier-protein] synthase-3|uniref:3-oxoacyl-[acyl-carrier-protein] synthase III C-terminal domain-containing protein n=1 Tax=Rouxiella badensis TaxID=1646377 RepID=UPI0003775A68|nr:3-oxoacyl-ACP synthase III family protein [Rouxiella badensis]QII38181.1 3-oxoacyl-ACP synthase III family protein [Rouxiella badensis]WAT09597.1 3-oxoacyl-ACP synthase III family protein [Rouxiella badensis]